MDMRKFISVLQVVFASGLLLWAVFMVVRLIAGGYDTFYVVCFGLMGLLGYNLLRISIKEMKGGSMEKPRDFDPFGQTGLSPLATI